MAGRPLLRVRVQAGGGRLSLARAGVLIAGAFLLFCGLGLAAVPPFWPEDNCVNTMNGPDPSVNLGYGTAAINPFAGQFEQMTYPTGIKGGPKIDDTTTPCKLTARVGETVSFNVIAEDVEPGEGSRAVRQPGSRPLLQHHSITHSKTFPPILIRPLRGHIDHPHCMLAQLPFPATT